MKDLKTVPQAYRLVWLQHFHKSAGTTIVNLAKQNGENFYPRNINGNPVDSDSGEQMKIWTWSDEKIIDFVEHCAAEKITFVATEWGMPNVELLKRRFGQRIVFITCLRDPFARLISNYKFKLYGAETSAKSLEEFILEAPLDQQINYYVKILSRSEITDASSLNKAKHALSFFSVATRLEDDPTFSGLRHIFSWTIDVGVKNTAKPLALGALKYFLKLLINFVSKALTGHEKYSTVVKLPVFISFLRGYNEMWKFKEKFIVASDLDYQLYNSLERQRE